MLLLLFYKISERVDGCEADDSEQMLCSTKEVCGGGGDGMKACTSESASSQQPEAAANDN
jgi:hypothetical protein